MVKQGKQQGIVVKEEGSKLSIGCRCSPWAFQTTMEGVKKVMKKQHHEILKKNPFYHYMDMPKINHSFHRVVSLMQAYNPEDRAFWFGGNTIRLEFTPQQLSIVLGLQYEGVPVDVNMDGRDTDFITRIFDGKLSLVTRPYIGYKLEAYAVMTDQQSVEDFSRLYTIYLLNTILLPKGNKTLDRWVYPHVEDLEVLGSFAWGKLVYDILVENMEGYVKGGLKYFDGCTIGLLAWVHERITLLGVSTSVYKFPRFFRWQDSKIPVDEEAARLLFDQIKQVQVIPFSVYPKEKALLSPVLEVISGPVVGIGADRFVEISSESSEDEIGDVEATTLQQVKNNLKRKRGNVTEEKNKEKKMQSKRKKEKEIEKENEIEIEKEQEKEKEKEKEKEEETERVNERENERETEKERETETEKEIEIEAEIEIEERENEGETNEVEGMEGEGEQNEERERNQGDERQSQRPKSKAKVPRVRGRGRGRGRKQVPVSKVSVSVPVIKNADYYRGRKDYVRRDQISEEDRILLDQFLESVDLGETIVERGPHCLTGRHMCELLFDDMLSAEHVDLYLNLLCSESIMNQHGHEIDYLDSPAQQELLSRPRVDVERMSDAKFDSLLNDFTIFGTMAFDKLNTANIFSKKFVMIPLNSSEHWFLLVLNPIDRCIYHWNSIDYSPNFPGIANYVASFYSKVIERRSGLEIESEAKWVHGCRQQDGNLDCGLFVCMWAYCHAVDSEDIWFKAKTCDIKTLRPKLATIFLRHRGVEVEAKYEIDLALL